MRVATDVGGTFTDLVYVKENGEVGFAKSSTTPPRFEEGVLNVLNESKISLEEIETFIHGTTVIINALTERKGVKTGLITTKGFRDVLEIARGNRPDLFNVRYQKPAPVVPRYLRKEVEERLNFKGEIVTPLDKEQLKEIITEFKNEKLEAVAIAFLHSYRNPVHEKEAVEMIKELWPEVSITASYEMTKEWREYERTNTVVMNSYVKPIASSYINRLEEKLADKDVTAKKYIMQSNGGTTTFSLAKEAPINMVESGPVAGVFGSAILGEIIGEENLIAFDVGGTTAKCSLIENGHVKITTDYHIERTEKWAGYPLKVPVVDIVEIGNGGGSIAWLDPAGSLRVGPHSAGAVPGPVAYGQGGEEPTITDANLITGRLSAKNFTYPVDLQKVKKVMEEKIANHFDLQVEEAALGIIRLANSNMLNALKLISVRKGYDPRDFTMVAFGGGGPLHATFLAKELGIRKVVIPVASAVFSAWGMLMTDLRQDFIKTYVKLLDGMNLNELNIEWNHLEEQAIKQYVQEGMEETNIIFSKYADMRYVGQEHTVKVPVPNDKWSPEMIQQIIASFHSLHEKAYTFQLPETQVEVVNLHLTAFGRVNKPEIKKMKATTDKHAPLKEIRNVFYEETGWVKTNVYSRNELVPGMKISGPAVIEDLMSSILLYQTQELEIDRYGNLLIYNGGMENAKYEN
ncbi:hydantoinase/oxoprolinase family protein [Peribacillus simplex]|uniref:hydantoinase/oxoprolinase family protein n=1 Tax=Peribacillus simplex TaxID=1478 RepID=UPI0024BFDF16|nr:hydantoinase/oxoprolinase family protein [Peribacillus simplex]WHY95418.1 hydantoinase/oxoprolinase family protein [Peribacillus simplex]